MAKKYTGFNRNVAPRLPKIETKLPKIENDNLSRYLDLMGVASTKALEVKSSKQLNQQSPTVQKPMPILVSNQLS